MCTSTNPKISVIVPVYNGGSSFHTCLSSLMEVVSPSEEVIVVGDGDTDGSSRLAKEFGTRLLRFPAPGGPARARNAGARAARGDILFFVDADVAVHPDTIHQVAAIFRREPHLAAVFGSYDDAPAEAGFLSQYKNLLHHYVHQTASADASTFWGACGAIRRDVFLALGGFDERYREPCIEDIELGYRLKEKGHKIKLCKGLQVKHLKRWTAVSLLKADFLKRALPWTELILRDQQLNNDLNTDNASRVSVMSVYGLLGASLGAFWWPGFLVITGLLSFVLLFLNAHVYRFFWRKRGPWFAVQTIPWHWFYYFYSGLAFAIGTARHLFRGLKGSRPSVAGRPEELAYTEE